MKRRSILWVMVGAIFGVILPVQAVEMNVLNDDFILAADPILLSDSSMTFQVLYHFDIAAAIPVGSLVSSGSYLYGTTNDSGNGTGWGTIFKIQADGSGFTVLHNFDPYDSNDGGARPAGTLALSGSTLYGMTRVGGGNSGTIFKINIDGSGFQVLHKFTGGPSDGEGPTGHLTLSDSMLYGVTPKGGRNNAGTIFKIHTDGTGFDLLYSFPASGAPIGPGGSLTLSDSILYGITPVWGNLMNSSIFRIHTDGTGFAILYTRPSGQENKISTHQPLIVSGSTLYGVSRSGGPRDQGRIYKINTDGSGFSVLHPFTRENGDGGSPENALLLIGSTLYGTTRIGGNDDGGTLFKIHTDGTGFEVLHHFAPLFTPGTVEGTQPYSALVQSHSALFGLASGGTNQSGILFSLSSPEFATYTLTTSVIAGHGTLSPSSGLFSAHTVVTLTAQPDPHYFVKRWTGTDDDSSTSTGNRVTMTCDRTVSAEFAFGYQIKTAVTGQGSVTTLANRTWYAPGEYATLRAVPQTGWMFDHWEGDLSGTINPVSLTVNNDMSIKAIFIKSSNLSIIQIGEGAITRTPSLSAYPVHSRVTLTAVPASGWSFVTVLRSTPPTGCKKNGSIER